MKIAIRDDDTSFFTRPEELQQAYDFVDDGPISLSVVPFTVPCHEKGVLPYGEGIPFGYYPIGDNAELVRFLDEKRYDVMLHGYSHEYQQINGIWYPEMLWKDETRIRKEMREGKNYLESVFGRRIRIFVAPNNAVNQKTIRSVEALSLNYSGIITHRDRDLSVRYVRNYIARWGFRLATGQRIPDVLDYGRHKEMVSYPLDRYEKLIAEYQMAKKRNMPFSVYTHYWQLNRDKGLKQLLQAVYAYAIHDGAQLTALSECIQ